MARAESPSYTPECCHEAIILRAYCESKWPIGPETHQRFSITGEDYTFLSYSGFDSAEATRTGAQSHFDQYASDKSGTLYWRVVPEIAQSRNGRNFAYYMRLLISDKPRKS